MQKAKSKKHEAFCTSYFLKSKTKHFWIVKAFFFSSYPSCKGRCVDTTPFVHLVITLIYVFINVTGKAACIAITNTCLHRGVIPSQKISIWGTMGSMT